MNESFARDVAAMADQCERDGNRASAAALRNISRSHRITALEQRANLAIFQREHADTSQGDAEV